MRKVILKHRSVVTIVQQMNVVNQKQLMSDFLQGKPVDINSGNTQSSYDFPDGEIDWEKPLMEGFPNKMEQYLNRSRIVDHLRLNKPTEPVELTEPVEPTEPVELIPPTGDSE